MLNSGQSQPGSVFIELVIGLAIVGAVTIGIYEIQHPPMSPAEQIARALQQ